MLDSRCSIILTCKGTDIERLTVPNCVALLIAIHDLALIKLTTAHARPCDGRRRTQTEDIIMPRTNIGNTNRDHCHNTAAEAGSTTRPHLASSADLLHDQDGEEMDIFSHLAEAGSPVAAAFHESQEPLNPLQGPELSYMGGPFRQYTRIRRSRNGRSRGHN